MDADEFTVFVALGVIFVASAALYIVLGMIGVL